MRRSIVWHSITLLMLLVMFNISFAYPEDFCSNAIVRICWDARFNALGDMKVKRWFRFDYYTKHSCYVNGLCNVVSNSNLKYGYIDMQYREAIPCEYDYAYPFLCGRAIVKSRDQEWAILDITGNQVVPFGKYERIFPYSEGLAQVTMNGRTGYIDVDGNVVIPLVYQPCDVDLALANQLGHFSGGYAAVKLADETYAYINTQGKKVAGNYTPLSPFSDGFALVRIADALQFIDGEGNNVFGQSFKDAQVFSEGLAYTENLDGIRAFIDTNCRQVFALPPTDTPLSGFFSGYSIVRRTLAEGTNTYICTREGTVLHDWFFKHVSQISHGLAFFTTTDGKTGTLNVSGTMNFGMYESWSHSSHLKMNTQIFGTTNSWWLYTKEQKDNQVAPLIACIYPYCIRLGDLLEHRLRPLPRHALSAYSEGLAVACETRAKKGFVDDEGKIVIPLEFADVRPFSEGLAAAAIFMDGRKSGRERWGYIDKQGKWVVKPLFSYAGQFCRGGAVAQMAFDVGEDDIQSADGRKYNGETNVVINKEGKIVFAAAGRIVPSPDGSFIVMDFQYGSFVNHGPMRVWFVSEKGDRLNLSTYRSARPRNEQRAFVILPKGARFSLVDDEFTLISESLCDDARFFSEGLCAVKIGPKWGYCDNSGKLVIAPQFDEAYDFEEGHAKIGISVGKRMYYDLIDTTGKRMIGSNMASTIFYGTLSDLVPPELFRQKICPEDSGDIQDGELEELE